MPLVIIGYYLCEESRIETNGVGVSGLVDLYCGMSGDNVMSDWEMEESNICANSMWNFTHVNELNFYNEGNDAAFAQSQLYIISATNVDIVGANYRALSDAFVYIRNTESVSILCGIAADYSSASSQMCENSHFQLIDVDDLVVTASQSESLSNALVELIGVSTGDVRLVGPQNETASHFTLNVEECLEITVSMSEASGALIAAKSLIHVHNTIDMTIECGGWSGCLELEVEWEYSPAYGLEQALLLAEDTAAATSSNGATSNTPRLRIDCSHGDLVCALSLSLFLLFLHVDFSICGFFFLVNLFQPDLNTQDRTWMSIFLD